MDVSKIDDELSTTIAAAWSSNTLSVRNSQWSKFISFCTSINQPPLPASTETVSRFLVWLARTCKYSTINNYVSAVVSLHKFHGYDPQFRDSFFIKMVLKGLKRRLGDKTVQMQPFSLMNLKGMYEKLDHSIEELLWTILIVSFRSLLRKSNLVPTRGQDDHHVLRRSDIHVFHWGIMLNVKSTKTLQCSEYVLQIPLYYVKDIRFCAASAVLAHMHTYPAPASSFLFMKKVGVGLQPVYYKEVLDFIKILSSRIGLDPKQYGCHSLRRSGAGFLQSIHVPLEDIMSMGDWHSLSVLDYLVTPLHRKFDIQNTVSVNLLAD